jgi:hypothetical protein
MSVKLKEYEHKAAHWAFTLPSFSSVDVQRLSSLSQETVLYVAFTICDNDTGNRYLQGFIIMKMTRRFRVAAWCA